MTDRIEVFVEADLEGNNVFVDFSDLCVGIYFKYGRQQNSLEFKPGAGVVELELDDKWISPVSALGDYSAIELKGQTIRILARARQDFHSTTTDPKYTIFEGFIDNIEWQTAGSLAKTRIEFVDALSKLARREVKFKSAVR